MAADTLIHSIPDLVLLVRRDGTVLDYGGGDGAVQLRPTDDCRGTSLEALWPDATATLLKQLVRRAIVQRTPLETCFRERGEEFEVRVSPRGPDRAVCMIRPLLPDARETTNSATDERPLPALDRRGFLKRFRESMSVAALREKPVGLAAIHIEGLPDVAQLIASRISEQVLSTAVLRLSRLCLEDAGGPTPWYLGQLNEHLLALVVESADRDEIEACVARVCASLSEPVKLGEAEFHLTPCAGVGIVGQDASTPKALIDCARAAAAEARRVRDRSVCFFTDTLKLRTLARLDVVHELRAAITNGDIRLRYVGRYDLATGRLVAHVGYVRWQHPLRGELRPAEFLGVAEATGLATALSRAALASLRNDFTALSPRHDVRLSFGALRHHVLHDEFVDDVKRLLSEGAIPADRLELRISEKALVAADSATFQSLQRLGVQLVIDEVARGMGSFQQLARVPVWGLQLDRAWVTALRSDDVARKVCRAGISVASALGLTPIATGVDDDAQRRALLSLGCHYGTGDFYENASAKERPDITLASGFTHSR
jgi:EAL domain-containing protein (putative c-di-GMP-specific phosphodiesterase class I)/GGDEF domain-containing protein